jgi:metal-sulfur cluster biosynthetic enzyme
MKNVYSLQSEQEVIAWVRSLANEIYDPCGLALGVSIGMVDMGLIRSLGVQRLEDGWGVSLRIRLTSPGCFYFVYFERELRSRLNAYQPVKLTIEWDKILDWTPDDLSPSAQSKLRAYRERLLAMEKRDSPLSFR